MTMDLAQSCNSYVTTIINGHDMIPTLSPGEALPQTLRETLKKPSSPMIVVSTFIFCGLAVEWT